MAKRNLAHAPRLCPICGQFQKGCWFQEDEVFCSSNTSHGGESFEMVYDRDLPRGIRWKFKFFSPSGSAAATLSEIQTADLKKSGLTDETVALAGVWAESNRHALRLILNNHEADPGTSLVIPYFDARGEPVRFYRIRPDQPSKDKRKKGGAGPKYLALAGLPNRLYFPSMIPGMPELIRDVSVALIVTEGEKKALCAAQQGFACVGVSGVWNWSYRNIGQDPLGPKSLLPDFDTVPMKDRRVVICYDSDRSTNRDVRRAEVALAKLLSKRGARVAIACIPPGVGGAKVGIDDFFAGGGTADAFRALLSEAVPFDAAPVVGDRHGRKKVLVREPESLESEVNDAVIAELSKVANVYVWGGRLCRVVPDAVTSRHAVQPLPKISLREEVDRVCVFTQCKGGEDTSEPRTIPPPDFVVSAILERGVWPGLPQLKGIVSHPLLRNDGSLVSANGFDARTGLFVDSTVEVAVGETPTRSDALAAVARLRELLVDFEFAEPAGESGLLTVLLTPLVRACFSGPVPMFLADANCRGVGKGLLLSIPGILLTGRDFPSSVVGRDPEETRKIITAAAIAGSRFILFDNVATQLGGQALESAITTVGGTWMDRVLGESRNVSLPLDAIFMATGNNIQTTEDMIRRIVRIRLETRLQNPEDRQTFRFPDLRGHLREHRAELLSCALTACRAWFVAGKPSHGLSAWGSFEGWSSVVREILVWCELPDPADTRAAMREQGDTRVEALAVFLLALYETDNSGGGLTARQIADIAWPPPDKANAGQHSHSLRDSLEALMNSSANPNSTKVGQTLVGFLHRPAGGFRLERGNRERGNVARWRSRLLAADPRRRPEPEDHEEAEWPESTPATPASPAEIPAEDDRDARPDRVVTLPPDPEEGSS